MYEKHGGEFPVLSAARFPVPVEWAYRLDEEEFLIARKPSALTARSQDLTDAFYDAGMFAIFPTELFSDGNYKSDRPMLAHQLPAWRAVDIDTEEDLFGGNTGEGHPLPERGRRRARTRRRPAESIVVPMKHVAVIPARMGSSRFPESRWRPSRQADAGTCLQTDGTMS